MLRRQLVESNLYTPPFCMLLSESLQSEGIAFLCANLPWALLSHGENGGQAAEQCGDPAMVPLMHFSGQLL